MHPSPSISHLRQPLWRWLALSALMLGTGAAQAQVSLGIALPGVSIGINVPVYPQLVRVPGYPVYYDPHGESNYFFYDGLYWVYRNDDWYESSWYNGPWRLAGRDAVPSFVLRVPVRYYRQPPSYFRGWRGDAAPRWAQHWGPDWQQHRPGWNQWDRRAVPAPAPLPAYQKRYLGERYPEARERQEAIRNDHYRFQPREAETRQRWQPQDDRRAERPEHGRDNRGQGQGRDRHDGKDPKDDAHRGDRR